MVIDEDKMVDEEIAFMLADWEMKQARKQIGKEQYLPQNSMPPQKDESNNNNEKKHAINLFAREEIIRNLEDIERMR
ncbi:MAG: hypothetical protein IJS68_01775 [Clostridia bacterium]|nr:hypothetical protein [Clostridia bacterium]